MSYGVLDGGLADMPVPSPETVALIQEAIRALDDQDLRRGGSWNHAREDRVARARGWVDQLERTVR